MPVPILVKVLNSSICFWCDVLSFVKLSCVLGWNQCLTKMRQRNLQISWIHAYVIVGLCISKMLCVYGVSWSQLSPENTRTPKLPVIWYISFGPSSLYLLRYSSSGFFASLKAISWHSFCLKDLSLSGNVILAHLSLNDMFWYMQTRLWCHKGRSSQLLPLVIHAPEQALLMYWKYFSFHNDLFPL